MRTVVKAVTSGVIATLPGATLIGRLATWITAPGVGGAYFTVEAAPTPTGPWATVFVGCGLSTEVGINAGFSPPISFEGYGYYRVTVSFAGGSTPTLSVAAAIRFLYHGFAGSSDLISAPATQGAGGPEVQFVPLWFCGYLPGNTEAMPDLGNGPTSYGGALPWVSKVPTGLAMITAVYGPTLNTGGYIGGGSYTIRGRFGMDLRGLADVNQNDDNYGITFTKTGATGADWAASSGVADSRSATGQVVFRDALVVWPERVIAPSASSASGRSVLAVGLTYGLRPIVTSV